MINIKYLIFDDETMRENNVKDIVSRLEQILNDTRFTVPLSRSKRNNWLGADIECVTANLLEFLKSFVQS
jgi:hypothetical protein